VNSTIKPVSGVGILCVALACGTKPPAKSPEEGTSAASAQAGAATGSAGKSSEAAGGADGGRDASGGSAAGAAAVRGDAVDCESPEGGIEKRPYCCAGKEAGYPHIQEAFCRLFCDEKSIYCVNERGDPLSDDVTPTLGPKDRVIVRVVADPKALVGKVVRLQGSYPDQEAKAQFKVDKATGSTGGRGPVDQVAGGGEGGVDQTTEGGDGPPDAAAGAGGAGAGTAPEVLKCTGACEKYRILSYEEAATESSTYVAVRLTVEELGGGATTVQRTYRFPVQRGFHWWEIGLSFPLTFNGTRKVGLSPLSGTNLQTLDVTESMSWALALNVLVFPCGVYASRAEDPRPWGVRHLLAPLALGFGSNVFSDRRIFSEGYLSLNYRVSSGASLGLGVAAVQGHFLKSQWSRNMVLTPGTTVDQVVAERYMFRPFVALTISPDILGELLGLLSKVQSAPSSTQTKQASP
jgi:hypothetical protein